MRIDTHNTVGIRAWSIGYLSCCCIPLEPNTSLWSNEHRALNLPGIHILMAKRFMSLIVNLKMNTGDTQKAHGSEAPRAAIMFLIVKEAVKFT